MSKYLGFEPTSDSRSYCFVSYDSSDTERITPIVSSLYKAGLDIWYDYGIEYSENWSGQISNRIKGCKSVLMFLSSSTFLRENPFVRNEYDLAKHFRKKIYIVIIDDICSQDICENNLLWWIELKQMQCIQAWKYKTNNQVVNVIQEAMGGLSSRDNSYYHLLENCEGLMLEVTPTGFWFIRLLVFAIQDSAGRKFIPLRNLRYGDIWSTPHIVLEFSPPRGKKPRDVNKILAHYENWTRDFGAVINYLTEHQFYQAGIRNSEATEFDSYTEYKLHAFYRDRYQCYRIEEHHVTYIDPDELINIYDPKKLHGYKYFPLDKDGSADLSSSFIETDGDSILFFGEKIATNIARMLGDSRRFDDCTYKLPNGILMDENGLVDG